MKPAALIAAAGGLVLLTGVAVGAVLYFKPSIFFADATPKAEAPRHSQPIYADRTDSGAPTKPRTLSLVEELGAVQDRIVRGDRTALSDQGRLLGDIGSAIRYFSKKDWDDYINVRASFVYVLSGGDAEVLKSFSRDDAFNEADRRLAQGIMSFAEGRTKAAQNLFADIDPRSLDVSLVGPFALAHASLFLEHDNAKAIALLDEARLASPHTAIEEAAARREIPALIGTGDAARAMLLSSSYIRRFGKSIYSTKLFRDLAKATAKRGDVDDDAVIEGLVTLADGTDPEVAANLLLDLAGEALLRGKIKLAKAAAGKVLAEGKAAGEDIEKARLYEAAADAPSGRAADALKALNQIAADRLSDEDVQMREVAGIIAHVVEGTELADASQSGVPSKPEEGATAAGDKVATSADLSRVTAAIESADAVLKKADLIIAGKNK